MNLSRLYEQLSKGKISLASFFLQKFFIFHYERLHRKKSLLTIIFKSLYLLIVKNPFIFLFGYIHVYF